jgi:hypothetical protein
VTHFFGWESKRMIPANEMGQVLRIRQALSNISDIWLPRKTELNATTSPIAIGRHAVALAEEWAAKTMALEPSPD